MEDQVVRGEKHSTCRQLTLVKVGNFVEILSLVVLFLSLKEGVLVVHLGGWREIYYIVIKKRAFKSECVKISNQALLDVKSTHLLFPQKFATEGSTQLLPPQAASISFKDGGL